MADKITELTPEQHHKMLEFRDEWMRVGAASGPADLEKVREPISYFYRAISQPVPPIVRVPSPMAAQILINALTNEQVLADYSPLADDAISTSLADHLFGVVSPHVAAIAPLLRELSPVCADLTDMQIQKRIDAIPHHLWEYTSTSLWGSQDSYWIAFYLFPHLHLRPMHTDAQMVELTHWATIAKNAFWWYPFYRVCIVCDRPEWIYLDEDNRLHCDHSPAVRFSDGWSVYAWNGILVDEKVIMRPDMLTVDEIDNEQNVEIRRVMISRFGDERYIQESGAKMVDETLDSMGNPLQLWRREFQDDETMQMIRKVDSSTERVYWERVPPPEQGIRTARAAVAWQFGLTEDEYWPIIEA